MTIDSREPAEFSKVTVRLVVVAVTSLMNFDNGLAAMTAECRCVVKIGFIGLANPARTQRASLVAVNRNRSCCHLTVAFLGFGFALLTIRQSDFGKTWILWKIK